ncbi:MAG TPA: hypothetical protein VF625_02005, partial [Longimicrobium sp.]
GWVRCLMLLFVLHVNGNLCYQIFKLGSALVDNHHSKASVAEALLVLHLPIRRHEHLHTRALGSA